ncbi:hypothetical protein [Kitasatospora sp. NPDC089509]|uniref:hypothetical protein n=1 Tax=Kitasatospora sp. NPDC089509 TaxID=3364079 RepID=UPI0037F1F2C6
MDPHDDLPHTRAALAAHHPAIGHITIHPTPATDSSTCLAYDLLATLGKPVPLTGTQPPWATAAAWTLASGITHLTVLRAHFLTRRRIEDLLTLRSRTGIRLMLVCHRPSVPVAMARALHPHGYHLAQARAVLPDTDQQPPPPGPGPLTNRWLSLSALTTLVAIDGRDQRCRCTAPTTEARGFRSPQVRSTVAEEIARRLHTATAHPRLAALLATAVFTAASTTQLNTVHPRDLAPDAAAITLHDPRRLRQGCMAHPVPAWARPFLLATVYLRRIAVAPDGPLFTPPFPTTGLPFVTRFAESCKLRPPQPPRPGPTRHKTQQQTVWPLSTARYYYPWAVTEDMRGCPPPPPSHRGRTLQTGRLWNGLTFTEAVRGRRR